MPTNEFLPVATAGGANVMSQSDYAAETARLNGVTAGTAKSSLANKSWRQSTSIAAAFGQFIVDYGGLDALDNGDIAGLLANFVRTYRARRTNYVPTVGGTANALTVTLAPVPASYSEINGAPFVLIPLLNNTGAATINFNGLGALPILTRKGAPVQRGDLLAGALLPVIVTTTAVYLVGLAYSEFRARVSALTIYVLPGGNDNNDGLTNTTAGACATIAGAINRSREYDAVGGSITIQLGAPATYAPPGGVDAGGNVLILRGDPVGGNQNNYIVGGTAPPGGASAMLGITNGTLYCLGITCNNPTTNTHSIETATSAAAIVQFCSFAMNAGSLRDHINAGPGGSVRMLDGNVALTGANSYLASAGGDILIGANQQVATGAQFWDSTARCYLGRIQNQGAYTFVGTGVIGPRYRVGLNGTINTGGGGANFFPGSSAGVIDAGTGGIYA